MLDFTWAQVGDQVRRMASHLKSRGWAPGSKIAILSKNCAWWLMSDLAIWMAGYVSVPLYPTLAHGTVRQILTHSEAQACFVGELDDWESMKPGLPTDLTCISYPLSPADARTRFEGWDAIIASSAPLAGEVVRTTDALATLIYTSGTHVRVAAGLVPQAGSARQRRFWHDRKPGCVEPHAMTWEAFTPDGWLGTGDKGHLDAQGCLYITGRVKDLFKTIKGKYVAPAPIEDKLVMHELVEACVVTGANLGQPLGIVVLNPDTAARAADTGQRDQIEATLAQHLKAVNASLDPHEQLKCLVVAHSTWTVDNDIVTPTFKVKRNRIEDLYSPYYETWEQSSRGVIWQDA